MFETLRSALTPPPLPPWEGLHVLVVHFPEALLVIVPVFVLLATILPIRFRWASWAGLILLAIGAAASWIAVNTGKAAMAIIPDGSGASYDAMNKILERHEELATLTCNVYLGILAFYSVVVLLPLVFKRLITARYLVSTNIVCLLLLAGADLLLANTGHLGGRLVHEFGVRAVMDKAALDKMDNDKSDDKDEAESKPAAKTPKK